VKTKHPQLQIEGKIYRMMQGGGNWADFYVFLFVCTALILLYVCMSVSIANDAL